MPKKKPTKKPVKTVKSSILDSPIVIFGIVFFVLLGGYFGYQKYLDWQNKRLIEGMAEDFPALIAGVEEAVDYPLEISSECLQTQEKFSEGVSLCGLVGFTKDEDTEEALEEYSTFIATNSLFTQSEPYREGAGFTHSYKNISCNFNYQERIRLDCAFGIRDANKPLASELFNEEVLNQKKNEALSR